MSYLPEVQTTSIATETSSDVFVRGKSLCQDLIGKLSFTEMLFFQILGRSATAAEIAMVDACLVTLVEHGLTPSAVATRLIYSSSPDAMQGAVAAGLNGVGSLFAGTTEGCAAVLADLLDAEDGLEPAAERIVAEYRAALRPIPGFGHPTHEPDVPRSIRLFEIAHEQGVAGRHVEAVHVLSAAIDRGSGKHITINATGAIAATLGDCGVPAEIMRSFALISRCAGLVGHVHEEQQKPALRAIWEAADRAVPYDGESG
jgi:citrate synthase